MNRAKLPNQLTLARLVLAGAFLLVLNQYRFPDIADWALPVATALFILAAFTDYLDGYLARRWNVETTFGRIMDPFCDKVLVLGAFIYLAGPRFVIQEAVDQQAFFNMSTGVYPWMVAVILARELLVTGIRGEMESQGIEFGAKLVGKLKTVFQIVTVPVVLMVVYLDTSLGREYGWPAMLRDAMVYATVLFTVLSGVPYITACARIVRAQKQNQAPE